MRAYVLSLLMMTVSLAGCLGEGGISSSDIGDTTEDELALPDWQIGDQWLYTFITPQFGEDSARLVVADVRTDDGLFMLGISSEGEAQRHAVINHNPFLGRVCMDGLSVYENGEPQPVFISLGPLATLGNSDFLVKSGRPPQTIFTTVRLPFLRNQPKTIRFAMSSAAVKDSSRAFYGRTMKESITWR